MSNEQLYRQCKMEKPTETGKLVRVAWIPTQFAKVGKKLSLREYQGKGCLEAYGEWEDGWVVVEAGSMAHKYDSLDRQRDAQKRWQSVLK